MNRPGDDAAVEALLRGDSVADGDPDGAALCAVLGGLRSVAAGPPPVPSAPLAALLASGGAAVVGLGAPGRHRRPRAAAAPVPRGAAHLDAAALLAALPPAELARRHRVGRTVVAGLLAGTATLGLTGVAAAHDALPDPAQGVVRDVVNAVTRFHIDPPARPAGRELRPVGAPAAPTAGRAFRPAVATVLDPRPDGPAAARSIASLGADGQAVARHADPTPGQDTGAALVQHLRDGAPRGSGEHRPGAGPARPGRHGGHGSGHKSGHGKGAKHGRHRTGHGPAGSHPVAPVGAQHPVAPAPPGGRHRAQPTAHRSPGPGPAAG